MPAESVPSSQRYGTCVRSRDQTAPTAFLRSTSNGFSHGAGGCRLAIIGSRAQRVNRPEVLAKILRSYDQSTATFLRREDDRSCDYNFSKQASPKMCERVESRCKGESRGLLMKVLIVDDHALIREALHTVLKQLKRETVILDASNSRQAMRLAEEHPDLNLILLDINLPDRDGFSVLGELRDRYATIAVIVLSALDDQDTVKQAFKLGALGFIPKTTDREVMLNAIQLVLSGGIYIPSEILDREETKSPRPANELSAREYLDGLGLTARQIEVLALLMQGKSNKVIANTLNMGVPTVKNQITVVLKALKVTSRTEAVIKVGKMGWELPPKP